MSQSYQSQQNNTTQQNNKNNNLQNITPQVAAMASIDIKGNVTPAHWYQVLTTETGKPHFIAITLLSDIVYWYRPTIVRNEFTGQVDEYRKKFRGDFLQRQTKSYANQFGISEKQAREALKYLEEKGLIKRHFRDTEIRIGEDLGKICNQQFIELIPSALEEIQKIHTYGRNRRYPPTKKEGESNAEGTYTNNTPDITPESTTTPLPPDKPDKEVEKPSASVVVSFSTKGLDLSQDAIKFASGTFTQEQIDIAIQRTLGTKNRESDTAMFMHWLKNPEKWVEIPSTETISDKNEAHLKSLSHLDRKIIADTKISVGNKYIEFSYNSNCEPKVFTIDQKDFIFSVNEFLENLKKLESEKKLE